MRRLYLLFVLLLLTLSAFAFVLKSNVHEIIPGEAFRSAQLSGETLKRLVRENGIRSIINLRRPDEEAPWYREEIAAARELGVTHYSIGMYQASPRIDQIHDLFELLKTVERPFLVHCRAGADRTGLASVLTLLIEGDQDLDKIQRQVTWRYGALRADSMGKTFLKEYRDWLEQGDREHSLALLDDWLERDYTDPTGNIHFLVHPINGQAWLKPFGGHADGVQFDIERRKTPELSLDGWAFDTRNIGPLAGMTVQLGNTVRESAEYGILSPWLLDDFGREEYLPSGWTANIPLTQLDDGCHDLKFHFKRKDGSTWDSPPSGKICIH